MLFKNAKVDGLNIFYREAGNESAPKLVLLHGFPASSHQYRNLMPALADRFHVIAPDYPGFGNSDIPDPTKFAYTFDKTSEIIEAFLRNVGFTRFGFYAQDYGGPVGFRIVTRRPDWLDWLIIQNTNAYEVGFTSVWDGLRGAYWKSRAPETEKPLEAFLQPDTVKLVYTHGHPRPELISPDNWNMDLHYLDRPNARQVQLDFFYDYRTKRTKKDGMGIGLSQASVPPRLCWRAGFHEMSAPPQQRLCLARRCAGPQLALGETAASSLPANADISLCIPKNVIRV